VDGGPGAAAGSAAAVNAGRRAGEGGHDQALWTMIVAVPAFLSILRRWVEAGGDLQTTLLLVEHVNPVNLVTTLVVTATWLMTAALVAVFAAGSIAVAGGAGPGGPVTAGTGGRRNAAASPLPFARWTAATPPWLKATTFTLAALTWQTLYLPTLLLAFLVTFQPAAVGAGPDRLRAARPPAAGRAGRGRADPARCAAAVRLPGARVGAGAARGRVGEHPDRAGAAPHRGRGAGRGRGRGAPGGARRSGGGRLLAQAPG
jgi:hypothetical protein